MSMKFTTEVKEDLEIHINAATNLTIYFTDEDNDTGRIEVSDLETLINRLDEFVVYDFEEEAEDDDDNDGCCTCSACGKRFCPAEEEEEEEEEKAQADERYRHIPQGYPIEIAHLEHKLQTILKIDKDGFVQAHIPSHPLADENGYYPLHRFFLENHLVAKGQYRYLLQDKPGEDFYLDPDVPVVFLNGKKTTFTIGNLALLPPELESQDIIQRLIANDLLTTDLE